MEEQATGCPGKLMPSTTQRGFRCGGSLREEQKATVDELDCQAQGEYHDRSTCLYPGKDLHFTKL